MADFISNNYIWLIVIAVVILLALIGYIAEKNGFGVDKKKDNNDNNKKEDMVNAVKEEVIPEEPKNTNEEFNFAEEPKEDVTENIETPVETTEEIAENVEAPVETAEEQIDEDLYAPIGDQEVIKPAEENIEVEEPSTEPKEESVENNDFNFAEEPQETKTEETSDFDFTDASQEIPVEETNDFDFTEEAPVEEPEKKSKKKKSRKKAKEEVIDIPDEPKEVVLDKLPIDEEPEKDGLSKIDEDLYAAIGDNTSKTNDSSTDEEDIWKF